MPETHPDKLETPLLSPDMEQELAALGADGAERLLTVLRGLFHCIGDLNARIAELEKQAVR